MANDFRKIINVQDFIWKGVQNSRCLRENFADSLASKVPKDVWKRRHLELLLRKEHPKWMSERQTYAHSSFDQAVNVRIVSRYWGEASDKGISLCLSFSWRALLAMFLMLVSWLAYSSSLMMVVTCSSEMSVDFQRTTQRYIPVGGNIHSDHCDVFIYAFSSSGCIILNDRLSSEQWIEKDMEGPSNSINWGTILMVAWSDCGKLQKP
jgi:hypothetical protein